MLSDSGVIAYFLEQRLERPVAFGFLYTMGASIFGLTLFGVMLTHLMIFSVMVTIDRRLLEANRDLGGSAGAVLGNRFPSEPSRLGDRRGADLHHLRRRLRGADPARRRLQTGLAQLMLSTLKGTYDLSMAATFAVLLVGVVLLATLPLALIRNQVRLQA